jgi:hypothetical protein
MTPAGSAGLVAPHIPADVREAGDVTELSDMSSRLARLVWPRDPRAVIGPDDAKAH